MSAIINKNSNDSNTVNKTKKIENIKHTKHTKINTTTKLYKGYQTVIPTEIRKARNLKSDDILNWEITEEGGC